MAILQMTIKVGKLKTRLRFSQYLTKGNWIVDWGDDFIEVNTKKHIYTQAGTYQITVKGDFTIENLRIPEYVISLDKEEDCGVTSLRFCFANCKQLKSVPHDWDVSNVKNMCYMFSHCSNFNQDLSHWNLEGVDTLDMYFNCSVEEKHKPKGL